MVSWTASQPRSLSSSVIGRAELRVSGRRLIPRRRGSVAGSAPDPRPSGHARAVDANRDANRIRHGYLRPDREDQRLTPAGDGGVAAVKGAGIGPAPLFEGERVPVKGAGRVDGAEVDVGACGPEPDGGGHSGWAGAVRVAARRGEGQGHLGRAGQVLADATDRHDGVDGAADGLAEARDRWRRGRAWGRTVHRQPDEIDVLPRVPLLRVDQQAKGVLAWSEIEGLEPAPVRAHGRGGPREDGHDGGGVVAQPR